MNGASGQEQQIQTVCLLIVSVVAVAVGLYWLRSVMVPFVFAVLIAFGLTPLIDLLVRYLHLPRSVALLATLLASFVMLGVVGGLISSSVDKLAARADIYQEQLAQLLDRGMAALPLERFGVQVERTVESLSDISLTTVSSMLFTVTGELLGLVSSGLLVMIFVAFMLVGSTGLEMAREGFWGEVQSRIQRYIIVKGLVSALTGVLVGFTLVLLDVDLALVFGVFAFLLNFIPSLGSIVATLLPLPVVLVSPDLTPTARVLAILVPMVIQFIIGNIVDPKLMGKSLDLHPVTLLLALILWGTLWGIVGMFLATPITAILKIIFERMEVTTPFAELLAGRLNTHPDPERASVLRE